MQTKSSLDEFVSSLEVVTEDVKLVINLIRDMYPHFEDCEVQQALQGGLIKDQYIPGWDGINQRYTTEVGYQTYKIGNT